MLEACHYSQHLLVDSGQCRGEGQFQSALQHMCIRTGGTTSAPTPQCVRKLTMTFLSMQCCDMHEVHAVMPWFDF